MISLDLNNFNLNYIFFLELSITIIFIIILFYLINKNKIMIYVFFPIFSHLTELISTLFLEVGVYITEQGRYSVQTLSVLKLLTYDFIFYLTIFLILNFLRKYLINKKHIISKPSYHTRNILFYFTVLTLSILYFNLILSAQIPMFSEIATRFNFWEKYAAFPFIGKIFGNLSAFIPIILGLLYFYDSKKRKYPFVFFLYLIYLLLVGQKFGAIIIALYLFYIHKIVFYKIKRERILSLQKILFLLIFLFGLLFYISILYNNTDSGLASNFQGSGYLAVIYRVFVLQGHLWWGVDYDIIKNVTEPSYNILNMLDGMHNIMRSVGNSNIERYIDAGINFADGYPSILYFTFNFWLGLLFQFISAIYLGIFISLIIYNLYKGYIFMNIILLQVHLWSMTYFVAGNLRFFISFKFFIAFIAILFLMLFKKNYFRKKSCFQSL